MRLFIAVNLLEESREEIRGHLGPLEAAAQTCHADVRWVRPDQFHLTVRFLGEFPEEAVPRLAETLHEALEEVAAFPLTLQGFGCFPMRGMPHALWIGVAQGQAELTGLGGRVEEALMRIGVEKERRPFLVHLTVGRIRFTRDGNQLRRLLSSASSPAIGPLTIQTIDIMQSVLNAADAGYTCLHHIPLKECR